MMSLEDQTPSNPGSDVSVEVPKKPRLEYSKEFLLSLSSLDACKTLPKLSEFEDVLLSNVDRPRTPGNLPFLGYRRNEHSSSPPTQGDFGNHSRGSYGSRWDSRSSGRSDRDSDSQSDTHSESGRRFDHQHRRSWQTPEHDGLLGRGSFPRPSEYAAGASSKMRTNEQYKLNKSREPYHPPRPYKAIPHSRRETDFYNDETFGLSESASEDQVEEEKRRRASFELIRKEQQKALQEKQKMNMEKRNGGNSELLENDGVGKEAFDLSNEPEVSSSDVLYTEKPSFAVQSPASRPIAPPGFNNTQEKTSELKSLILPSSSEVTISVSEKSLLDVEVDLMQHSSKNFNTAGKPAETKPTTLSDKFDKEHSKESLDVHFRKLSFKHRTSPISNQFDSFGNLKHPEQTELNTEALNDKPVGDTEGNESTSILEKIFGSTLSAPNAFSSSVEVDDGKPDDARSHSSVQSSKFAQWFFEEEDNACENIIPSSRPNDLLSFLVTGDKANVNSGSLSISSSKEEAIPTILTCEDLEQSMLSEYDTDGKPVQPLFNSRTNHGASMDKHSEQVDNLASLHLFSMLQKSAESNASVISGDDVGIPSVLQVSHKHEMDPNVEENIQSSLNMGQQPLTLETLFGTAFMKELHSVGAPVSAQRGPIGSAQSDENSSFVVNGNDHRNQMMRLSKAENLLGFNDRPDYQIPYQNIPPQHHQQSSPQLNQGWGPFHHLESKSTENLVGPDSIFNHNSPSERQFHPNMVGPQFHQSYRGFDAFHRHPLQQMQGNHPTHHMFPDFPPRARGGLVSGHGNEARANFERSLQEMNNIQGFPLRPHMPGDVNSGGNTPEAFQRLIAMQLRANSNQIHRPFGRGHGHGGGNEIDMGFQYP